MWIPGRLPIMSTVGEATSMRPSPNRDIYICADATSGADSRRAHNSYLMSDRRRSK